MSAALRMRDLEAETGVSREAIHFYLREGLLPEPERPKRNVALYTDEHVFRIRAIKRLQQERSLSLEAIKEVLAEFDYEALATGDDLGRFEATVQALVDGALPTRDVPLAELAARADLQVSDIEDLHDHSVVRIVDGCLDYRDVGIVMTWAELLGLGMAGKEGYDATYLARFVEAFKPIAATEVDIFLKAFGDLPTEQASELAARGINVANDLVGKLRTQALMRELRERQ